MAEAIGVNSDKVTTQTPKSVAAGSARPSAAKSLGLAACTAIVVGNMVGSGFYLSPAAVAPYGNLAIVIWMVMGAGAICLGLTFAKLARLAPATGGPYAYTRLAYGDFPGFLIAWVTGFLFGGCCRGLRGLSG